MTDDEKQILVEMHGMLSEAIPMMKEHRKWLLGNGRPGLLSRMTRAETIIWVVGGISCVLVPILFASK